MPKELPRPEPRVDPYKKELEARLKVWNDITPINYEKLQKVLDKWLVIKDKGIVKLLCAAILAHVISSSDKVWLYLVAPPSSGKTEFLRAFSNVLNIEYISNITPNAFLSGSLKKNASLLTRTGNPIIIFKDFTNILSQGHETREEIMGQLREIFDGYLDKPTGNGVVRWRGRVTVIAGVTYQIDTSQYKTSGLGERFLTYRMELPDEDEASDKAWENADKQDDMRNELLMAFAGYLRNFIDFTINEETLVFEFRLKEEIHPKKLVIDRETQIKIRNLAKFTARARAQVDRNYRSAKQEIEYVHKPEMPMRMIIQFSNVLKALRILNDDTPEEDIDTIYKLSFDSLHEEIRRTLMQLTTGGMQTTKQVAIGLDRPTNMIHRKLEELTVKGMVKRTEEGGDAEAEYFMQEQARGDRWVIRDEYAAIVRDYMKQRAIESPKEDSVEETEEEISEVFPDAEEVSVDSTPFD